MAGKWEYKVVNLVEGLEEEALTASFEQLGAAFGVESEEESNTGNLLREMEKRLNQYGKNGWELVVLIQQVAILKREKK